MTSIRSLTVEVADPAAAESFYAAAFGLGDKLCVRPSLAPTAGFRGYTFSLVVSQPNIVDTFIGAALDGGATPLKPAKKGFWGYGGVVQAPDGTIWKVATSSPVKLALYGRSAAAKDAGVPPDGTGSHRIVIDSDTGPFTDPDGFAWETA